MSDKPWNSAHTSGLIMLIALGMVAWGAVSWLGQPGLMIPGGIVLVTMVLGELRDSRGG